MGVNIFCISCFAWKRDLSRNFNFRLFFPLNACILTNRAQARTMFFIYQHKIHFFSLSNQKEDNEKNIFFFEPRFFFCSKFVFKSIYIYIPNMYISSKIYRLNVKNTDSNSHSYSHTQLTHWQTNILYGAKETEPSLIRNFEKYPQNWPIFGTKIYLCLEKLTFSVKQCWMLLY